MAFGSRVVLSDANLLIPSPAQIAIMGPSGSGKSTLLGLLAGHIKPESGLISIPQGMRLDWVVQNSPVLPRRSVLDNIAIGALAVGDSYAHAIVAAHELSVSLEIDHVINRRAGTVSGGEKQRIAVARGIAAQADILLVDEPTASLDAHSRDAVCRALKAAAALGALVVIATHDPVVAAQCDTVYQLVGGQLARG